MDLGFIRCYVITKWYYNDSDVNYNSSLLEECEFGLGVAVQLVDAVSLQGNGLQESVQFREAQNGIKGDLFEFVVGEKKGVDFCVDHVVENLVELVVLQASSDEFYDLDRLPVELVQEDF